MWKFGDTLLSFMNIQMRDIFHGVFAMVGDLGTRDAGGERGGESK